MAINSAEQDSGDYLAPTELARWMSTQEAAATHPVLSGPAISRLKESDFEMVIVTNTIPVGEEKRIPIIKVLSVAGLLGEAIRSIHEETSVSGLFI